MNDTNDVTEIEVFYRGMAMIGLLMQGVNQDDIPTLAKNLAERMLEDSPEELGLAAIKPKRRYNRK